MSPLRIGSAAACLAAALVCGCAGRGPAQARPPAPTILTLMVPEMEKVPGFDDAAPCKPDQFPADVEKALADWATKRHAVERVLTPAKARELSRWAKKQMETYTRVTPLADIRLKLIACDKDRRRLVLEGDVDKLPTHSALVTRWLKVYLLYDQTREAVVQAAVTIRGQLLE